MYYIYHIPKKKIGVTSNPKIRVEKIQGYKPREYEILLKTEDIDEASKKEIELQKQYGYKIDTRLYKNLKFNKKIYGISMLIEQALPCFKQWFGFIPAVDESLIKKLNKKIK